MSNTEIWDALKSRIGKLVEYDTNGGCWLWSGFVRRNGYASMTVAGKTRMAHRVSYTAFVGEIPDGLVIDHKCKRRCCVNPRHLEAVTYAENNRRSPREKPLKTHCVNGHSLSGENLYPGRYRRCAECARRLALAAYHKGRAR